MTEQQLAALERARTDYLEHRRLWGDFPEPDRARFNKLEAACRQMLAALDLPHEYLVRIKANAQDSMALEALDIDALLIQTIEALTILQRGALPETGRGGEPNNRARVWAWIAADAWRGEFGAVSTPSASDRAPFWRALEAFQALHPSDIPHHSKDSLRSALAEWRKARGANPG